MTETVLSPSSHRPPTSWPPGSASPSLLFKPTRRHLTQHNGEERGQGYRCQAGQLCVPLAWLLGDPVTACVATSSSTGQQVQLGPRWPDSCRSLPLLLPPRSVSRPRPRPPGEGAGLAPPPRAPFSAPGTHCSRLLPPLVKCALAGLLFLTAPCPTRISLSFSPSQLIRSHSDNGPSNNCSGILACLLPRA